MSTINSGLNDQMVSSIASQQAQNLTQFNAANENSQANDLTVENVNKVISQVCGSQETNTHK